MFEFSLDDTRFVTSENKEGLSNSDTVFHYFQEGEKITGHYAGGEILQGQVRS